MRRALAAIAATLLAVLFAACGAKAPASQPKIQPKPGAVLAPQAPHCTPEALQRIAAGNGEMGDCAPVVPRGVTLPAAPTGVTGPDTSNNDPLTTVGQWRAVRAHGHPFGYVKVNQGSGFVDLTAHQQVSVMHAAHVAAGGYDFLEVCVGSPVFEARLFDAHLFADGLVHAALAPTGDAEWPLRPSCSAAGARAWLTAWSTVVRAAVHRWPAFYSGAWWWDPNVGCWRPPHALRWVSGYTLRRLLSIPCGWGGVDLWQYTDAGWNGASSTDMSRLEVPLSRFKGAPAKPDLHAELVHLYKLRKLLRRLEGGHPPGHLCRRPPNAHPVPNTPAYRHACWSVWIPEGQRAAQRIEQLHRKHIY